VQVIEQPMYPDLRNEGLVDIQAVGKEMFSVEALGGRLSELGYHVDAGRIVDESGNVISEDLVVNSDGTVNLTWRYTDKAGKPAADMDVFHAGNIRVIDGQLYCAGYRWDAATESWKAEQNAFPLENPEAHVGWFYLGDIANGNWARFMDRMLKEMGPDALDALFAGAWTPGKFGIFEAPIESGIDLNNDGVVDNNDRLHDGLLGGTEFGNVTYEGLHNLEGRGWLHFAYCPDGGTVIMSFTFKNADGSFTSVPVHLDRELWAGHFDWLIEMTQSEDHSNSRGQILWPIVLYPDSAVDLTGHTASVSLMANLDAIQFIIERSQDGVLDSSASLVNWSTGAIGFKP